MCICAVSETGQARLRGSAGDKQKTAWKPPKQILRTGPQTRFQSVIFGPSTVIFTGVLLNAALFSIRGGFKELPHKGVFVLGLATEGRQRGSHGVLQNPETTWLHMLFVLFWEYLMIYRKISKCQVVVGDGVRQSLLIWRQCTWKGRHWWVSGWFNKRKSSVCQKASWNYGHAITAIYRSVVKVQIGRLQQGEQKPARSLDSRQWKHPSSGASPSTGANKNTPTPHTVCV